MDFEEFPKIARLSRNCVITEKLDGTNAQIAISEDVSEILAGSRTRWITPEDDNYGFAKWVQANKDELLKLGPGRHYGEWWGAGIQRKYGMTEKRFSLFNTARWSDPGVRPKCCHVVPVLYNGIFSESAVGRSLDILGGEGSVAAPGFMDPEGICIWHEAARVMFKKTLLKDEEPKGFKK